LEDSELVQRRRTEPDLTEWDNKFNLQPFKEGIPMWEKLASLPEIDDDTLEEIWAAYDQV